MLQTPATLQMIQDIKQGLIPVGKAVKANNATSADNDGKGNNIASTYAKKGGRLIPLLYTSTGQCIALFPSGTYPDVLDMGFINGVASGATLPSGWNMGDFVAITAVNDLNVTVVNQHNGNIFGYTATGKYDVGDYYISNSSTSPAAKYGGSWTQLQGRFILGAGMGYVLGATGGEANVTMTENQMPSHRHNFETAMQSWGHLRQDGDQKIWILGTENQQQLTYTGGNQPHNNMPPYRVAYIWYRVS